MLEQHENVVGLENTLASKRKRKEFGPYFDSFFLASKKNKMRSSFYLVFEYLKHDL
jgi:hypothetical protein